MSRYNRRLFLWVVLFALCAFGTVGTALSSQYDMAIFQSQQATIGALTRNAPTFTPTPLSTRTPIPTSTITSTPTPCTLSLSNTTVFTYPSLVNFKSNFTINEDKASVFYVLNEEPWWFVNTSESAGWVLDPQDVSGDCSSLTEENLARIQLAPQSQGLFFEDTFETQLIDWQRSDEFTPLWKPSGLLDENGLVFLDAPTLGNRLWLENQPRGSDPQLLLDKPISASEWMLTTSFQFASVGGGNYFGIRLNSTTSEKSSLELRLYLSPVQCKYEIASYSNTNLGGKVERTGAPDPTACALGEKFLEPNDSTLLVPYGFLQVNVTYLADRQAIKLSFSFNGSSFSGAEMPDPNGVYQETTLGLVSAEMRSYLDYIVITTP